MYKSEFPKVTLFVYSYNHEKFISQAIQGAFAQTYPNLEIILSDDHSSDKTFAIMQDLAAKYKGPHRLLLNCNEKNLGITGHLNKIVSMGAGEWFVLCAGDDVSHPDRVAFIMDQAMKDPSIYAVNTGYELIDENGRVGGCSGFVKNRLVPLGATGAWHRKLFDFFGPLQHATVGEDEVIPFRAILLGKLLLSNKTTIRYRQHTESISNPTLQDKTQALKHLRKLHVSRIGSSSQRILDLKKAYEHNHISKEEYEDLLERHRRILEELDKQIYNLDIAINVYESTFKDKIKYLFNINLKRQHRSFLHRVRIVLLSNDWIYSHNRQRKLRSDSCNVFEEKENILIDISRLRTQESNLLMWE